jgi:hypothetical protein
MSRRGKAATAAVVVVAVLVVASMGGSKPNTSGAAGGSMGMPQSSASRNVAALAASPTPEPTPTDIPTAEPTPTDAPTPEPTAAPTDAPTPTPAPIVFATLTSRNWALVVKSPDTYLGNSYKVWGCISQFDAATGPGTFRAQASYHNETYWYLDGTNTMFNGDATLLADFVTKDAVQMNVISLGSFNYDTTIGGSQTVPMFTVVAITRIGSC